MCLPRKWFIRVLALAFFGLILAEEKLSFLKLLLEPSILTLICMRLEQKRCLLFQASSAMERIHIPLEHSFTIPQALHTYLSR